VFAARGTFLFDEAGQPLLDLVNNPASLGHCHKTVVAAAAQQMAVLNTNTRYVYPELADYAEALTATLPEKLSVCYFVNSGSEANDLALRIARQYTQGEGVVCVEGAYHGHTAELVKISPYKFDGKGGFPQPPTTEKASPAATAVQPAAEAVPCSPASCPLTSCNTPLPGRRFPSFARFVGGIGTTRTLARRTQSMSRPRLRGSRSVV
jgi:4-aminobutyrate aminotransferase-like enzyme